MADRSSEQLGCMEIWGGNQGTNRQVKLAGMDAWIYSRPEGDAPGGGDIYFLSSCATGRITRMFLGDVSGHGLQVARASESLRNLVRRNANRISQARFVRGMNREFVHSLAGHRFATGVVMTFFVPTRYLSVSNAGHPPPLFFQASTGHWCFLRYARRFHAPGVLNLPLGIMAGTEYDQFGVRLAAGDMVLCYTDALNEARLPGGERLGLQGLLDSVAKLDPERPAELLGNLLRILRESGASLDQDDLTLLLLRPNGERPRVPLKDVLLGPLRMLKACSVSAWRGEGIPWPEISLVSMAGPVIQGLHRLWGGTRFPDPLFSPEGEAEQNEEAS